MQQVIIEPPSAHPPGTQWTAVLAQAPPSPRCTGHPALLSAMVIATMPRREQYLAAAGALEVHHLRLAPRAVAGMRPRLAAPRPVRGNDSELHASSLGSPQPAQRRCRAVGVGRSTCTGRRRIDATGRARHHTGLVAATSSACSALPLTRPSRAVATPQRGRLSRILSTARPTASTIGGA